MFIAIVATYALLPIILLLLVCTDRRFWGIIYIVIAGIHLVACVVVWIFLWLAQGFITEVYVQITWFLIWAGKFIFIYSVNLQFMVAYKYL